MKSLIKALIPIILGITFVIGCKHHIDDLGLPPGGGDPINTGTCDPTKVYFPQQVLPILVSNCAMSGCHDDITHESGVILNTYEKVMSTSEIRPGRPFDSKLYKVITDPDPNDRMPPAPRLPLTPDQILLIRQWIEQGALNLGCQSLCDSNQFTYSGAIRPMINNKCLGCHSGPAPQGGVELSTYDAVKLRVTDGKLWGSINHLAGYSPMPKNGIKLSECEINQVRKWIDAGAPNN